MQSFLGGNFKILSYQYPLILVFISCIVVWLFKEKNHFILEISMIGSIVFFYVFIHDTGIYSALVTPIMYFFIALIFQYKTYYKMIALSILLTLNFSIFIFKQSTILLTFSERNPEHIEKWAKELLPANSKVVGDDVYFYAVTKNKSSFQYVRRGSDIKFRVNYHSTVFKADYLFFSKKYENEVLDEYLKRFVVLKTFEYKCKHTSKLPSEWLNKLGINATLSYDGVLYKVKPK